MSRRARLGTVMIVDDAPGNLALLSDALEEAGYGVLVATDGLSAIEQLRFVTPDIILLDGVMPGIDGFETCRQLKANPATQRIPILFMTALGDLDNLLRGFQEGAVDYIVKPFRNEEVLARIGAQLAQARDVHRAEQALSQSGMAALTVDRSGAISWSTPGATRWLHELTGELGMPVKLPATLREWLGRALADPGDSAGRPEFSVQNAGQRFNASLASSAITGEYLLLLQKRAGDWDPALVRENLGLTFKETEVLMWIARGKTNRDVGQILGSSPRTVNKHLEHIFEKLGVETRSAAVAVVMEKMGA